MSTTTVERSETSVNAIIAGTASFEVLPLSDMWIASYQRPLEKFVEQIVKRFNPALLGVLTVSERPRRGKKYAVIDGQTRREAMKRLGLEKAPCLVFYNLGEEQEAVLFSEQRHRKTITPYQRFRADLVARDHQAMTIKRMVEEEEGFRISDNGSDWADIKAIRVLEQIYVENPEHLRTVLRLIRETWSGMPYATSEPLMRGLYYFVRNTKDLDEQRFVERLSNVTPSEIDKRSVQLREGRGLSGPRPRYMTEVLRNAYHTKRRGR